MISCHVSKVLADQSNSQPVRKYGYAGDTLLFSIERLFIRIKRTFNFYKTRYIRVSSFSNPYGALKAF